MLDDFAERMGPDLMPTCSLSYADGSRSSGSGGGGTQASSDSANASNAAAGGGQAPSCPALGGLSGADGLLDSRFLHLCCPTLDHARQLFSSSSFYGGGHGGRGLGEQVRRVKKIRPTAPSGTAAARAVLAAAAPPLAATGSLAQAEAARNLLRLQLQRAFLDQYSTDEHKVGGWRW